MKTCSIPLLCIIPIIFLTVVICSGINKNNKSATGKGSNSSASISKEFIRSKGRKLVVGVNDKEIILQGFCFGNNVWDNPVMPPKDHHDEKDFARLKKWKANAIRFYMNYQLFEDDANPYNYKQTGWEWLDRNVTWAKSNGIYLILSMHVPQGGFQSLGQGNALWNNKENQTRLKALWRAIAGRYKNETAVAGYDLLNEPNTSKSNEQWVKLAYDLVREIRSVDPNHLVIVERLNAINNIWLDPVSGFFLIDDINIMYTFHFYDPFEYTSQFTSWTFLANQDGGCYPDLSKIYVPSDTAWAGAIFNNPRAPSGNFDWTYFNGVKFQVTDTSIIAGKPLFFSGNNSGKIFFDDFNIVEYDENSNYLKTVFSINVESIVGWSYWCDDGSGSSSISDTEGHNDIHSIYITGSTARAFTASYNYFFEVIPGHYYSISGWMKGINATGESYFGIDFMKSPSGGKVLRRNKEYISCSLSRYINWGISNNVPLYCGEFGCYFECYKNNKGGSNWLRDMLELFKQSGISYTYHDYHEPSFGIFPDKGLPVEGTERKEIVDVFINAWR